MRGKKTFDKHTFMEGFPILQEVTPTDDLHPAHWWDTNDGQLIRVKQQQYFNDVKNYQKFVPCNKEGFGQWVEALNSTYMWPDVSERRFWTTPFGQRIITDFWAVVNKFISYLNSLE